MKYQRTPFLHFEKGPFFDTRTRCLKITTNVSFWDNASEGSVCFPRIFGFSHLNLHLFQYFFWQLKIQMRHFWMIFKPCARSPINTWPFNHWHRKGPNVQLRVLHMFSIHWNFSWPTPVFYIPIDHFHSSE